MRQAQPRHQRQHQLHSQVASLGQLRVVSSQADLQRQRNEVAQHREIVKETIGGMTELAGATKKEIDDLTDKMQAELAEVKFCHELSR